MKDMVCACLALISEYFTQVLRLQLSSALVRTPVPSLVEQNKQFQRALYATTLLFGHWCVLWGSMVNAPVTSIMKLWRCAVQVDSIAQSHELHSCATVAAEPAINPALAQAQNMLCVLDTLPGTGLTQSFLLSHKHKACYM